MIKFLLSSIATLMITHVAFAQQMRRQAPDVTPIDSLSDNFSDTASLKHWQTQHNKEGYPNKLQSISLKEGSLYIQPAASGWYSDYQAPFLFKTISGNFTVRTKIKVSGLKATLPQTEWSLAGLMVREEKAGLTKWEPRKENWLFITTGIAEPKGTPVFEVKTTNNSMSNLKLRPAKEGWVELRIMRIEASFLLMYRYEGEEWTILERFYRPLMPYKLQVGINAYSGWNEIPNDLKQNPEIFNKTVFPGVKTDMMVEVDQIEFKRPVIDLEKLKAFGSEGFRTPYYSLGNLLTDYSISNKDLLRIIGG